MHARFVLPAIVAVNIWVVTLYASAVDKPKSDARKAYMEQAATTALHAVRTELEKQSRPLGNISLDLAFQVDPAGQLHNIKVTANKSNESAQDAAGRALAKLKLPRFPQDVAKEVGNTWIDITTPLVVRPRHTSDKSTKPDSPDTVAYLTRCNEIIMAMLDAEVVKHRGDFNGTLEIILLLDRKGHVVAQKIIATPPLPWLNDMATRVVRNAKLPAMPAKIVAEHKGDMVPFATKWVYERKG